MKERKKELCDKNCHNIFLDLYLQVREAKALLINKTKSSSKTKTKIIYKIKSRVINITNDMIYKWLILSIYKQFI